MRCAVTFSISEQQTAHPAGLLILAGDLKHAELKYQYYQIYTSMLIFQQAESKKTPKKLCQDCVDTNDWAMFIRSR